MGKLEKIPKCQLTKARNKKEVIDEARNEGRKVHFASLMDLCHLKNSELEPNFRKYQGRVVLRGDIVKDDSGSYAVFTEQGLSASQTTAAKVMDVICKTTRMRKTSSRRSIRLHPGQNGRCTNVIKTIPNRNVQIFGYVYHDTNDQNHGPVWKIQSSLLNGTCTVILWQDCFMGKAIRKKFY